MAMLTRGSALSATRRSATTRLGALGGVLLTTSALVPAAIMLGGVLAPVSAAAQSSGQSTATRSFDIAAQPLQDAIVIFSRQSGIQVSASGGLTSGRMAAAVRGDLAPAQALGRMLTGTGLSWRMAGNDTVVLEAAPPAPNASDDSAVQLGTLRIEGTSGDSNGSGNVSGDNHRAAGWDGTQGSVYATPGSVSVVTRETLERYPAQSPADMLRGATGIIAAEARTSGGLDVNIRGMQGQGRVPVTVDGAINGTTVYRGYQGTSNRSFVDPDFISHVAIEKGPSMGNAIAGGIGGSVSMSTLSADDIVPEGDDMAVRIKASLSNNSSQPRSQQTRSLLEPRTSGGLPLAGTRENDRPGFLEPTGGSASLVFARKSDVIDIIAGYSLRRTGNYHAGTQGDTAPQVTGTPSAYCTSNPGDERLAALCARAIEYYTGTGSTPFVAGEEVLNTSTDTESVLLKAVIRPAADHSLELGYGGYRSSFGENYPGSVGSATATVWQTDLLSHTTLDRFTARYRWNPSSDWLDVKLNGWISRLEESAPSLANTNTLPRYTDSWGADLTNSSRISTGLGQLSADYGVSFLREDAGPVDGWVTGGAIPPGREGSRREVSLFGQLSYEPVSWLRLDGGLRYQSYDLDDRQTGTTYHTEIFSRSEDAVSFSLGGALMPVDGLQIFGSYKQAARLPSLMEATTGFFMIANPDLHKEEAHNWEVGVNYLHNGLFGSDDQLGLKLTGFDNDINGYISRRYISQYFAMQMFNIDRAKFRGLEGSLSYKNGGFSLDAGATFYDHVEFCRTAGNCVESSLASDYGTNYIPPRWAANVSASQTLFDDRLMLGARATYMGKRIVGAEVPQSGYMPLITAVTWQPYVVVDMTGSLRISDGLSLDWSVDNITDRYYNEAMSLAYVPAPGRTFRIGFTGTFGSGEGGTANAMWPGNWFGGNGETTDWTGPYVGASLGYGMGGSQGGVTTLAGAPSDLINNSRIDQTMRNFVGGLQAGYNYQLPSNVVLGVEADITAGDLASWSSVGLEGDQPMMSYIISNGAIESDTEYKWDRMVTLRGKLGYAMGQTLIYGTAGLAWLTETQTRNQYRSYPTSNDDAMGVGQAVEHYAFEKDRQQRAGAVFGAGIEQALGRNWSMRVDYGYAKFDRKDFTFKDARGGIVLDHGYYEVVGYQHVPAQVIDFGDGFLWEIPAYDAPINEWREVTGSSNVVEGRRHNTNADIHTVRVGINFRF